MEALIINGEQVDTADVAIPLDYQSNLFGRPDVIKTNRTYTVKLPRTDHNERVLGYADVLGRTNGVLRKYNNCTYVRDGVEIIAKGSAVLLGVTPSSYEVCLTWGFDAGVLTRIKSIASLRDLTLPSSHKVVEWSANNLETSQPTQAISVGYAPYNVGVDLDTGRLYDPSGFLNPSPSAPDFKPELSYRDLCNIHPFITLKAIKEALESTCSFILDLPTSVANDLHNKCLLLTSDENTLYKNVGLQKDSLYSGIIDTRSTIQPPFTLLWAVFQGVVRYRASNGSDTWRVQAPSVELNGALKYEVFEHVEGVEKSYGIKMKEAVSSFDVEIYFKTVNDLGTGGIGSNDLYVMKDHPDPWGTQGTTLFTKSYTQSTYTDTLSLSGLNLQAGDVIYFSWKHYSSNFTPDLDKCESRVTISNIGYATPSDASLQVPYPKMYDIESNLPTISGMDFIKLLANIYGLYFTSADAPNVLKLKSYEGLLSSALPLDLTDKFIRRSSTKFMLSPFAQVNTFKYKQDSDKLDTFDGELLVNDETLTAERAWVTIPFAATNDDLLIHQYDIARDAYKYTLSKTKKDLRIMGLKTNYNGVNYSYELVPSAMNFDTIVAKYSTYKNAIDDPFVIEVDVSLTTYEAKNFQIDRPVYLSQFGYSFAVLKMRVKNLVTTLTLLKL